jgi:hypothetical protein
MTFPNLKIADPAYLFLTEEQRQEKFINTIPIYALLLCLAVAILSGRRKIRSPLG